MESRTSFVTSSGSVIEVYFDGKDPASNRDAVRYAFKLRSAPGPTDRVFVVLVSPPLIDAALQNANLPGLSETESRLALLAAIRNADRITSLETDKHGNRIIEIEGEQAVELLSGPPQSDRAIRRFIARRVHDSYSRSTLKTLVVIDDIDFAILGATVTDFIRNSQLLEEESYVEIVSTAPLSITIKPTAKLVRDVERYGSVKEDVVSQPDYVGAITAYPVIAKFLPVIELEYRRYSLALSPIELESVFKAIAPLVENLVKDLLRSHGSTVLHASLGPAINEMRERGLGGISVPAQLSYILKFGRDLAQHGESLPLPVLRIACENAFEVIPQLAALYRPQTLQ